MKDLVLKIAEKTKKTPSIQGYTDWKDVCREILKTDVPLVINNKVMDIEVRDINVFDYYHEEIAKLFIDCPADIVKGDYYRDGVFIKRDEDGDE